MGKTPGTKIPESTSWVALEDRGTGNFLAGLYETLAAVSTEGRLSGSNNNLIMRVEHHESGDCQGEGSTHSLFEWGKVHRTSNKWARPPPRGRHLLWSAAPSSVTARVLRYIASYFLFFPFSPLSTRLSLCNYRASV